MPKKQIDSAAARRERIRAILARTAAGRAKINAVIAGKKVTKRVRNR